MSNLDEDETLGNQYLLAAKRNLKLSRINLQQFPSFKTISAPAAPIEEVEENAYPAKIRTEDLKRQLQKNVAVPVAPPVAIEPVAIQQEEVQPVVSFSTPLVVADDRENHFNDLAKQLQELVKLCHENANRQRKQINELARLVKELKEKKEDDATIALIASRQQNSRLSSKRATATKKTVASKRVAYEFGYDDENADAIEAEEKSHQ
jgi:hypothetical protein